MERVTWKLTLPYVKQIANGNLLYAQETQTGALYQSRGVGWDGRWEGGSKVRDICILMADSSLLTTPKPLTVWITINCGKF